MVSVHRLGIEVHVIAVCVLFLADWRMEGGDIESAVQLLHQAASQDVSRLVATRIWGEDYPYRALWPDKLELRLEVQIPASIGSYFGWNQLNPGMIEISPSESSPSESATTATISAAKVAIPDRQPPTGPPLKEELIPIRKDLEQLANRLQQPGAIQSEGRFPVYVLITSSKKLNEVYGGEAAEEILQEMKRIQENISFRKGWDSLVFLPDDEQCAGFFGIACVEPEDPWQLKLALADLDLALAFRAASRIGVPARASPREFADAWRRWLDALGWCGGIALDAAEHAARGAWNELLAGFVRLTAVAPRMTRDEALAALVDAADAQVFEPETPGARVRILGVLEAAGLSFDALWIAGLSAEAWPRAPEPNPLLPIDWQRSRDVPRATAARELAYARALTARLDASAARVVFSFADTPKRCPCPSKRSR